MLQHSKLMIIDWLEGFPDLAQLDEPTLNLLTSAAQKREFSAGSLIYQENQTCDQYLLIVNGMLRVYKASEDGSEFVLARMKGGNPCGLTTSSLLLNKTCLANCLAESPAETVLIPKSVFNEAMGHSENFRRYVFESLHMGMSRLVEMVGDVIFTQLDHRLASKLIEMADDDSTINATHDTIATELGTAREVVSRLLKEFERNGWVKLNRKRIQVLNPLGLRALGAWI